MNQSNPLIARSANPWPLIWNAPLQTVHIVLMVLMNQQGGITCGTIDEPRKSSKAIDERVIINFRDKNVVIARFRDKNGGFLFYR